MKTIAEYVGELPATIAGPVQAAINAGLKFAEDELKAWRAHVMKGEKLAAMKMLMAKMTPQERADAGDELDAAFDAALADNDARQNELTEKIAAIVDAVIDYILMLGVNAGLVAGQTP